MPSYRPCVPETRIMRSTFTAVLVVGITLSCTGGLTQAATVYQWTAEDGTVHFSDVPPTGADTPVTREIEFEEFEAVDPESAGYSIVDQARDMVEMRSALTEQRIAEKRLAPRWTGLGGPAFRWIS